MNIFEFSCYVGLFDICKRVVIYLWNEKKKEREILYL